ncbi:hypothetical protein, partial [Photobacterium sanguinicancri]|uniref:hypothetical protein n=1 Tax=Photobacterium sanguinicancri TaxID=875932 RepID=UPI00114053C3
MENRRIPHALYCTGWNHEDGIRATLLKNAQRIIPTEYAVGMKGALYCPACFTNLSRTPEDKEVNALGTPAYFKHQKKYEAVPCTLRARRAEGKKYNSYESVKQAIDDDELVIVSGFLEEKPEAKITTGKPYDDTPVDDVNGEETDVPLSQHDGQTFKLPSTITTIAGMCRNFDTNYFKYYLLPEKTNARQLCDTLVDIRNIQEEDSVPKLYFARILSTRHFGENKKPTNCRMTFFNYPSGNGVGDFCLKMVDWRQREHGITDDSLGRVLLMFGKVTKNGTGLCLQNLKWGEFSLLPIKYEYLLFP